MRLSSNKDPISLVEAAYRSEPDQGAWLVGLAQAASSVDDGLGITWRGLAVSRLMRACV